MYPSVRLTVESKVAVAQKPPPADRQLGFSFWLSGKPKPDAPGSASPAIARPAPRPAPPTRKSNRAQTVYKARVDTVYRGSVDANQLPTTIECDDLLELEHLDGKQDGTWALVNRQCGGLVSDDRLRETFVLLRIADKTLWAVTTDYRIADPDAGLLSLTQVRMVSCLAVAYVEANDRGEAMPVLALKAPQIIRDHVVRPENPADALRRLVNNPENTADVHTITQALRFLQLRCIELQGPADNAPKAS